MIRRNTYVQLQCQTNLISGGVFEWFHRALNNQIWTFFSRNISNNSIQFNGFRVSDAGYYACVVKVGNDTSRAEILVDVLSRFFLMI